MNALVFDAHGRTLVDATGAPLQVAAIHDVPAFPLTTPGDTTLGGEPLVVQRIANLERCVPDGVDKRMSRTDDPLAIYALAVLHHRESCRFDPLTGAPLEYSDHLVGTVSRKNDHERPVFPRIDPAVIGIITLRDSDRILVAQNAARPGYHSLIAGYVGLGETFEDTMAREAWEETGRRISDIRYLRSQPWPYSGSIMVGFSATTTDEYPVGELDGEVTDIRWATKTDVLSGAITLPGAGSLARSLIMEWVHS